MARTRPHDSKLVLTHATALARMLRLGARGLAAVLLATTPTRASERPTAPDRLADTGLYSDAATLTVATENLPFTPQYPLWSDGAAKRRWIQLPPGTSIDARDPDAWRFPVGTKLWKEFSFGRRVETRYMELAANGEWLYATYVWSADGREAQRAPDRGVRGVAELAPHSGGALDAAANAPRPRHDIPSVTDCRACHQGNPTEVLGFGALQLSSDRDPLAPHAEPRGEGELELTSLVERGLVRNLPPALLATPPRVDAPTPSARAALGYLHANCGHCHNARGPLADLGLALDTSLAPSSGIAALRTAVGVRSTFRLPDRSADLRIAAGEPDHSLLVRRMSSRKPLLQMPPLGTRVTDDDALALVREWIASGPAPSGTPQSSTSLDFDLLRKPRQP